MKEKFINFLKEHDALEKFESNLKSRWNHDEFKNLDDFVDFYIEHGMENQLITSPFEWPDDEVMFWGELAYEWEARL